MKSLISLSSPYFFSLHSLVSSSAKYLFPLIFSNYPFTLLKTRYKGFILKSFTYFQYFIATYPIQWMIIIMCDFSSFFMTFSIIWIKILYIDNIINKIACAAFYIYFFDIGTHFYNTFMNTKFVICVMKC